MARASTSWIGTRRIILGMRSKVRLFVYMLVYSSFLIFFVMYFLEDTSVFQFPSSFVYQGSVQPNNNDRAGLRNILNSSRKERANMLPPEGGTNTANNSASVLNTHRQYEVQNIFSNHVTSRCLAHTDLKILEIYDKIFTPLNESGPVNLWNPKGSQPMDPMRSKSTDETRPYEPFNGMKRNENRLQQDWQKKRLRVFIVPHSHNDAGWVRTFMKYYTDQTKIILDNVLKYLSANKKRKFVWCEISFFSLWWQDITSKEREDVKKLISSGQLEFIGGGWVMPDEANVHYFSHLTQITEGHQWLLNYLQYKPRTDWAIDPFGLSTSLRYMNKEAGLDRTVFSRTHHMIKEYFRAQKQIEFVWSQPWDVHGTTDVLSHVLPFGSYDSSDTCGPENYRHFCTSYRSSLRHTPEDYGRRVVDPGMMYIHKYTENNSIPSGLYNPRSSRMLSSGSNGINMGRNKSDSANKEQQRLQRLRIVAFDYVEVYRAMAKLFRTSNIMIPMGGDFAWQQSYEWDEWLSDYELIMEYISSHPEFNTTVEVATLEDYFTAVEADANFNPASFSGDFFTYADRGDEYWSGYFTSRIFHKRTERQLLTLVRGAQIIYTLMTAELLRKFSTLEFPMVGDLLERIVDSRRNLGIFQHHDGITGTSKTDVMKDYKMMLDNAVENCQFVTQQALHVLTSPNLSATSVSGITPDNVFFKSTLVSPKVHPVKGVQAKVLEVTLTDSRHISVYNPLEISRMELVEVTVDTINVKVVDFSNEDVPCELGPVLTHKRRQESSVIDNLFKLYVLANVPPLGVKNYVILYSNESQKLDNHGKTAYNCPIALTWDFTRAPAQDITLSNRFLSLTVSTRGNVKSLEVNGRKHKFGMEFLGYRSDNRSGLYIVVIHQNMTFVKPVFFGMMVVRGKMINYAQIWLGEVTNRLVLYDHPGLECESIFVENIIDLTFDRDVELAMRITTDINSNTTFYTDSNGVQMMKRRRLDKLPMQANIYPMAASAFIEDSQARLTLVAGQPGGLTSLKSGQLEVMLDRIMSNDDGRGVDQPGMDNVLTTSVFKILMEAPNTPAAPEDCQSGERTPLMTMNSHLQLQSLLHPLQVYYAPGHHNTSLAGHPRDYQVPSGSKPNACDVHLVSLSPLPQFEDRASHDPMADWITIMKLRTDTSIVLHRVGLDPRFDAPSSLGNSCIPRFFNETNGSGMSVKRLLGDLIGNELQMMSLTFTEAKGELLRVDEELPLQPLQMYAFKGNFSGGNRGKDISTEYAFKKKRELVTASRRYIRKMARKRRFTLREYSRTAFPI